MHNSNIRLDARALLRFEGLVGEMFPLMTVDLFTPVADVLPRFVELYMPDYEPHTVQFHFPGPAADERHERHELKLLDGFRTLIASGVKHMSTVYVDTQMTIKVVNGGALALGASIATPIWLSDTWRRVATMMDARGLILINWPDPDVVLDLDNYLYNTPKSWAKQFNIELVR